MSKKVFAKIPEDSKQQEALAKIPEGKKQKKQAFAKIDDSEPETVAEPNVNLRQIVREAGFIRVDGLKIVNVLGQKSQIQRSFAKVAPELWSNNGVTSIRFPNGEIWVGKGNFIKFDEIENLIKEGTIKRVGYFVPFSNGEIPTGTWDFYRRMMDPDWIPDYVFNPDPGLSWRP